jgi:tetratricopeptide (TPR) repeat protein
MSPLPLLNDFPLLAADPALDPPHAGTTVGVGVVVLGLVAGIMKCWQIMQRPTTHGTCVASLLTLLGALLVAFGGSLVVNHWGLGLGGRALLGVAAIVMIIASAVLGVVGMVDLRKRQGDYTQGWSQAFWGILVSVVLLALIGVGAWSEFNASLAERGLIEADGPQGQRGGDRFGDVERFESLNFAFRLPGAEWTRLEAKSFNPDANLVYMAPNPETYFIVIAEKLGIERRIDVGALVEVVKAKLASVGEAPTFDDVTPGRVAGIDGMFVNASGRIAGQPVHYRYWVATHRGYCYQLMAHGPGLSRTKIDQRAAQMMGGFEVIDPERIAHAEGFEAVSTLESATFGCRLDLSGGDWILSPQANRDFPAGEFLATLDEVACVSVVAFCLPEGVDPPLDEIVDAVLTVTLADYDESRRSELLPIVAHGVEGAACDFDAEGGRGEGPVKFLARAFKHDGRAYVAIGWADASASSAARDGLDAALASITFSRVFTTQNAVGPAAQQMLRGLILNELGLFMMQRQDDDAAAKLLADAARLRPDDEVVLSNYLVALEDNGEADRALAVLDEALPRFPRNLDLRATKAALLEATGDRAAGRTLYEQLFRDGYADQDSLMALLQLQLQDDDVDAALASVDDVLRRRPSWEVERWKGQLLSQRGDHEAALALFHARRERRPTDWHTAYDLADAQEIAEQYAEALEICKQFADAKTGADLWLLLRGRCQLGLKWYREARESFQAALDLNPQSEDARELTAFASSMLGQGNLSGATTPIEPVPIPAELQARIDALPPLTERAAEFGLAERMRVTGYSFVKDRQWRCTAYRSFQVFGPEGVDALSSLTVPFDPLSERVFVNRLVVRDAAGNVVAEGNIGDYYVTDDNASGLATTDQTLNVPVPQLKPGCTLEFAYTREFLGKADAFGFESVILASTNPVQLAAAFVVGDADQVAAEAVRVDEFAGTAGLRYWVTTDPEPYAWEPDQACLNDFMPFVYLSDKGAAWEELGREHYDSIKERLAEDPQVAARAREIAGDAATPDEKVARLAGFVQRELTYQGLEFGIRGQMPNPAARTLRAGYGDCKDHAVLLQQMLNAVGVKAEIALVLSAGRVVTSLPSIDQFDHMVVFLPEVPPERAFVDCTSKHSDPASPLFPDLEGGHALILDPDQPRLVPTPAGPVEASILACERVVEVAVDAAHPDAADAIVTETVTCNPTLAPTLRETLATHPPQERKGAVADLLREYSRVTLHDLAIEGLTEPREPLVLKMTYRVPRAFRREASGALSGTPPTPWEQWWIDVDAVDDRRTPFELRGSRLRSQVTLKLPEGWRLARGADDATSRPGDTFLDWELDAESQRRSLRVRQVSGVFEPARYARFYDETQELLDALKAPIVIETTGP